VARYFEERAFLATESEVRYAITSTGAQRVCADGVLVQLPHSIGLDVNCLRDLVFELGGWEWISSVLCQIGSKNSRSNLRPMHLVQPTLVRALQGWRHLPG
jgi:hypothetical protein